MEAIYEVTTGALVTIAPDGVNVGLDPYLLVGDAHYPDRPTGTVALSSSLPPSFDGSYYYRDGAWELEPAALEARREQIRAAVNGERDLRVRMPFAFASKAFDYDEASQKRITGAAALAGFAMTIGGKAPNDPLWHGGAEPFTWIAADNSLVSMDAATTLAFGQAAAAWESAHVFAARALKDAIAAAKTADDLASIDITAGWPE